MRRVLLVILASATMLSTGLSTVSSADEIAALLQYEYLLSINEAQPLPNKQAPGWWNVGYDVRIG